MNFTQHILPLLENKVQNKPLNVENLGFACLDLWDPRKPEKFIISLVPSGPCHFPDAQSQSGAWLH